jgi:uncharacterized repeat protein (TIGR01451 family)
MQADPIPGGLTLRSWTNVAEITADSAASYSSATEEVTDTDSVPGDDETSAADDQAITDAGGPGDEGYDDEDIAVVTTEIVYDLALSKVVDAPEVAYDDTIGFTVIVANQGNVPSGPATVTDLVPPGLAVADIGQGGVVSEDGTTIAWTVELAPGEQAELTYTATIADLTTRPWTNVAEITTDGAASYSSATEEVTDADSVPGDDETSTADDQAITDAGGPGDEGYDDEDIAVVTTEIVYDLAIDKRLAPEDQAVEVGLPLTYEVEVTNQGNVPSGPYSFTDTLPAGMAFASASDGGTADAQVVTWTDRPSLDPGESATVTVTTTITDGTERTYRNWVEITADSADTYSTADDPVTDIDSTPANGEQGEDDDDFVIVEVEPDDLGPSTDDTTPSPTYDPGYGADGGTSYGTDDLARTGTDLGRGLQLSLLLLTVGTLLVAGARRRRRPA